VAGGLLRNGFRCSHSLQRLGAECATIDHDSLGKERWERYCTAFTAFFFPAVHEGIDWERGYAFLDQSKVQDTARDPDARYAWKWRLARGLYHRGWSRQDVLELFRFLDWVLVLPEAAEDRLWAELQQYEEQQVMRYVTSVERIGIKKGLQQGLQQGRNPSSAPTVDAAVRRTAGLGGRPVTGSASGAVGTMERAPVGGRSPGGGVRIDTEH
jgi:hypothetical protein